jgi:hypothetical protein
MKVSELVIVYTRPLIHGIWFTAKKVLPYDVSILFCTASIECAMTFACLPMQLFDVCFCDLLRLYRLMKKCLGLCATCVCQQNKGGQEDPGSHKRFFGSVFIL